MEMVNHFLEKEKSMTLDPKKLEAAALYVKEHCSGWDTHYSVRFLTGLLEAYGVPELEARAARAERDRDQAVDAVHRLTNGETLDAVVAAHTIQNATGAMQQEIIALKHELAVAKETIARVQIESDENWNEAFEYEGDAVELAETLAAAKSEIASLKAELARFVGRPIEEAPKDGTMLRLLCKSGAHPLADDDIYETIGFNSFDDSGIDEWQMAGWNWCHDKFCKGDGIPTHFCFLPAIITPSDSAPAGDVGDTNVVEMKGGDHVG